MMTENRGIQVESREMLLLVKELLHTGMTSLNTAHNLLAKLVRLEAEPSSSPEFDTPRNRPARTQSNGHAPEPDAGLGALLPSRPINPDQTYDVDEAARVLRRSKVSLRKLVNAGKIKFDRSGDGSRAPFVFKGSALIEFINRPKTTPGDDET